MNQTDKPKRSRKKAEPAGIAAFKGMDAQIGKGGLKPGTPYRAQGGKLVEAR